MKRYYRFVLMFAAVGILFLGRLEAAKILGYGDSDYDICFLGTPMSAHALAPRERVDAVQESSEGEAGHEVVTFKIDRVLVGEFPKVKRGGPSRFSQAKKSFDDKNVLDIVGLNYKNPEDEIDRESVKIAVKNAGETFGITVGQPLEYFQHKIYLKRIPKNPQTFRFVRSQPVAKKT